MIRVLYGTDEFAISERLRAIRAEAGPPEMMETNTNVFEGRGYSLDELVGAALAVPFLSERRLIIVRELMTRLEANSGRRKDGSMLPPRGDWKLLPDRLEGLPPSTLLVFVEGDIRKNSASMRLVGSVAELELFTVPARRELDAWVAARFRSEGADATPAAVSRLCDLVGGQTRLLAQEIQKLALYCGGRQVQPADVNLMIAPAREASVFTAVDGVLDRRPAVALRSIRELLDEGNSVQYLISMLARQTRMTLVAQEMTQAGAGTEEIARRIGVKSNSFPLRKTLSQARTHRRDYLEWVHRQLLEADVRFKTSGAGDERGAAEMLVARLSTAR